MVPRENPNEGRGALNLRLFKFASRRISRLRSLLFWNAAKSKKTEPNALTLKSAWMFGFLSHRSLFSFGDFVGIFKPMVRCIGALH